jgi:hypothetical protein
MRKCLIGAMAMVVIAGRTFALPRAPVDCLKRPRRFYFLYMFLAVRSELSDSRERKTINSIASARWIGAML